MSHRKVGLGGAVKQRPTSLAILTAVFGAGLSAFACSDEFDSCRETRTCPVETNEGGGPGNSSQGGVAGAAGVQHEDAGANVGGAGAAGGVLDTRAPKLLDVSPADGERGVAADTVFVVRFNEPMDRLATEDAYESSSAGVTPVNVSFSWNDEGTELTITPNAPLAYAEGADAAVVAAREYGFSLATTARDEAGNPLMSDIQVEFATLRRIKQVLEASAPPLSGGYVQKNDGDGPRTTMAVGCLEDNEVFRAFVSFQLEQLPADIAVFEEASLKLFQQAVTSTPTPFAVLGDLQVFSMVYESTNAAAFDAMDSPTATLVGVLGANPAAGYKTIDITDILIDDYRTRERSQFGIRFKMVLNGSQAHDVVHLADTSTETPPVLEARYLVP
jgi:hypothetical protein